MISPRMAYSLPRDDCDQKATPPCRLNFGDAVTVELRALGAWRLVASFRDFPGFGWIFINEKR